LVRGTEHAQLVQLSLEYDPSPPFQAGSPLGAGEPSVQRYQDLAKRSEPERELLRRQTALKLGFEQDFL
jgi:cyclohexyl-isocyanide hydratase